MQCIINPNSETASVEVLKHYGALTGLYLCFPVMFTGQSHYQCEDELFTLYLIEHIALSILNMLLSVQKTLLSCLTVYCLHRQLLSKGAFFHNAFFMLPRHWQNFSSVVRHHFPTLDIIFHHLLDNTSPPLTEFFVIYETMLSRPWQNFPSFFKTMLPCPCRNFLSFMRQPFPTLDGISHHFWENASSLLTEFSVISETVLHRPWRNIP